MKFSTLGKVAIISAGILALSACSTEGGNSGYSSTGTGTSAVQTSSVTPIKTFKGTRISAAQMTTLRKTNVFFKFNSSSMEPQSQALIQQTANEMLNDPSKTITLQGFTDARGSAEYNVALGLRRSKSVERALMKAGVSSLRMKTMSYGAARPLALGHTEAAYRLNRRVHFQPKG